jgi:hypothetical protein
VIERTTDNATRIMRALAVSGAPPVVVPVQFAMRRESGRGGVPFRAVRLLNSLQVAARAQAFRQEIAEQPPDFVLQSALPR